MNAILRKCAWLRWALLLPISAVYAEASCANAARDVADGLNNAANSIDGDDKNDFDEFVDDFQELFH